MRMRPQHPIFIPSKGRAHACVTMKAFDRIGLEYKAVVEPQEFTDYACALGEDKLLVLPFRDRGLVATRNWIWDYAQFELGAEWFWTFDDNIRGLYRYQYNIKTPCLTPAPLRAIEDFAKRYKNVAIAGCNYFMFVVRKSLIPAVSINRRVYSNMFINTSLRDQNGKFFRNEGRFNDDTDLNLRVLKSGYCTLLFNAFLIDKMTTMTLKGGMDYERNEEDREKDHRYIASKELEDKHPDVARVVWRFGRWHHYVDYSPYAGNLLERVDDYNYSSAPNEYGMVREHVEGVNFLQPDEATEDLLEAYWNE